MTETAVERYKRRIGTPPLGPSDDYGVPVRVGDLRALLAVVEAAQEHYDEWARINPPELLPLPIQKLGKTLAALHSQASDEGTG